MPKRMLPLLAGFLLIFPTLSLFFSAQALAGEAVRFLYGPLKPLTYEENGEAKGIDIDRVRKVCAQAGLAPAFQLIPGPWAMQIIQEGKADGFFTLYKTVERETSFVFSEEPLGVQRNILVGCSPSSKPVAQLEELQGALVGVVKNYAYGEAFANPQHFSLDFSSSEDEMVNKCRGSRLDYFAINEYVFREKAKNNLALASLPVQPYVVTYAPYYFAFSKTLGKKAERWALQVSDAIRVLRASGELPALPQKSDAPTSN